MYCETTLLLFKPGTNDKNFLHKELDNAESDLYMHPHEALYDFVHDDTSACPELIREEFKSALKREAGEEVATDELDIDQLVGSPLEEEELETLDDNLRGLIRPQEDMTTNEQVEEILAIQDDVGTSKIAHDADHNWAEDRETLELTDEKIDEAHGWIKTQRMAGNSTEDQGDGDSSPMDPASLNQNQRWVFDAAMEAIDKPESQKFIDVCGGAGELGLVYHKSQNLWLWLFIAGTGKSYTINTILGI